MSSTSLTSKPLTYPVNPNTGLAVPNDLQKEFHRAIETHRYVCMNTGFGAGKTVALVMAFLKHLVTGKLRDVLCLVTAPTHPQMKSGIQRVFVSLCYEKVPKLINKITDDYALFSDGCRVEFKSFERGADQFQGIDYGFILMDEGSLADESVFTMLIGRLRNSKIKEQDKRILIATNPNGKNWIYKRFFKDPGTQYKGIVGSSFVNKDNLHAGYIEDLLKDYSEDWVQRFVYGSFDTFIGQIFTEFIEEDHVEKPFQIPSHWYKFRGIDFGWSVPSCCLWIAEDDRGVLHVYRELYKANLHGHDLAVQIKNLSQGETYDDTIGDTSGAKVDQTSTESVFQQLAEHDIFVSNASKQDKLGRIDRMKVMLRTNKIKIFSTCTNLIAEMPQYQWEPQTLGKSIRQQRPLKVNDHAIDALSYVVTSRPDYSGLPDKEPKIKFKPGDIHRIALPPEEIEDASDKGIRVYY